MKRSRQRYYVHRKVYRVEIPWEFKLAGYYGLLELIELICRWSNENSLPGDWWRVGRCFYFRDSNVATMFRLKWL